MAIYLFGNPDLPDDSVPLRILPELKKRFPQLRFKIKDPNEEWDCPEELTAIDTVRGIEKVGVFDNLAKFAAAPRLTIHDFDALTNLRYLQKLGKLKKIQIIGVPAEMNPEEAFTAIAEALKGILETGE